MRRANGLCGAGIAESTLARPERFELPAYCSGGLAAQEINNLAPFAGSGIRWYL